MALMDDVKKILNELAPHGWKELFEVHGLDIMANNLEEELSKDLKIVRNIPGFKDFSLEGSKGITPGIPSLSLVYHALASPAVLEGPDGKKLAKFPSVRQIETIENYVYASSKRTLSDVLRLGDVDSHFGIAVFALEYRNSKRTVHGKHADLCFSRTGIARIGNEIAKYVPDARGFRSFVEGDDENTIRTVPARYACFISIQLKGNKDNFGPARFSLGRRTRPPQSQQDDNEIDFWVPIHKLFSGTECLTSHNLNIVYKTQHTNEKLRRVHIESMGVPGFNTGFDLPEINNSPFIFHDEIARISNNNEYGSCQMEPIPHSAIVKSVEINNKKVFVNVPERNDNAWSPTYNLNAQGTYRKAPEYVHVRDKLFKNGNVDKLNDKRKVKEKVDEGKYRAMHYIDFTGDGWVVAECSEIDHLIPRNIPAYSVVAACDFFPQVDQGALMDWWLTQVPSAIREQIWAARSPLSLSDQRTAPNLQLKEVDFRPEDISVTALVSQLRLNNLETRRFTSGETDYEYKCNSLPDGASGIYQPGWDISIDFDENRNEHLALYGLGSPFPEDAKLCAALSTFWPAAAPDSSRQYAPQFAIVCPLTDDEIGLNDLVAWDGNTGPRVVENNGKSLVEYNKFNYVDSTENAANNKISILQTSKITFEDYTFRVLGMNRVYQALRKATNFNEKNNWGLISFKVVNEDDPDLTSSGVSDTSKVLKFDIFKSKGKSNHPTDFKRERVSIDIRYICLYNGSRGVFIRKHGSEIWETIRVF